MKRQLAIYGAGGLGREISIWASRLPDYSFIGFFDDNMARHSLVGETRVLGGVDEIGHYSESLLHIVVAVGDCRAKEKIDLSLSRYKHIVFPSLVHPKAILEDPNTIRLGKGTIVTAGCVLTTTITIGDHTLLNLNSTIGHDVVVGSYCSVMPGAHISGRVTIGKKVLIGTGACLLNGVEVGDETKIGAGAVVINNVPFGSTAIGVPARIIQRR